MIGLCFLWYLPIPLIAKFFVSPFYGLFIACALFTFWYCVGEDVFDMRMSDLPPNGLERTRVGHSCLHFHFVGPAPIRPDVRQPNTP